MEEKGRAFATCPMGVAMGVLGGKWKLAIVWRLFEGKLRFNELQRLLGGVTAKVLAQQLRELENDDIVSRLFFPEVPPRVEYELTETGRSLEPVLDSMCSWGKGYLTKDAAEVVGTSRS
jgi:DNA-binding HxlR family transcriptional regulator